jgi:hypothetical protein
MSAAISRQTKRCDGRKRLATETTTYAGELVYIGMTCLQALGGRLTVSREDGKVIRFERRGGAIYVVGDWALENLDAERKPA